jgi:hypothetical protein
LRYLRELFEGSRRLMWRDVKMFGATSAPNSGLPLGRRAPCWQLACSPKAAARLFHWGALLFAGPLLQGRPAAPRERL